MQIAEAIQPTRVITAVKDIVKFKPTNSFKNFDASQKVFMDHVVASYQLETGNYLCAWNYKVTFNSGFEDMFYEDSNPLFCFAAKINGNPSDKRSWLGYQDVKTCPWTYAPTVWFVLTVPQTEQGKSLVEFSLYSFSFSRQNVNVVKEMVLGDLTISTAEINAVKVEKSEPSVPMETGEDVKCKVELAAMQWHLRRVVEQPSQFSLVKACEKFGLTAPSNLADLSVPTVEGQKTGMGLTKM